jgi:excisionase family DNA binding protein
MGYLTMAETAEMLKIEEGELMSLIEEGKLRAIRIGRHIRIREEELERLETTCPAGPAPKAEANTEELPAGSRLVSTRSGRAQFRVAGSVATGAEIWPGKMRYPIKMPAEFMRALLSRFSLQEVPVGGKFDDPTPGSLGEFIQDHLQIKMNPAVYLAALLIDEGYAVAARRRGYVQFLPQGKTSSKS